MHAAPTIHAEPTPSDRRALRIVVIGTADGLQRVTVNSLRSALYRVYETTLPGVRAKDVVDGFDLLVLVASDDHDAPRALELAEAARSVDPTLPIIIVAQETAYLDLWPRTAELEVTAFYSLSADLPQFLATVDDLLLAA